MGWWNFTSRFWVGLSFGEGVVSVRILKFGPGHFDESQVLVYYWFFQYVCLENICKTNSCQISFDSVGLVQVKTFRSIFGPGEFGSGQFEIWIIRGCFVLVLGSHIHGIDY